MLALYVRNARHSPGLTRRRAPKKLRKGSNYFPLHQALPRFYFSLFVFFALFLRDLAGFDFGFEELKDIDGSLIIEAAFGIIELGESG